MGMNVYHYVVYGIVLTDKKFRELVGKGIYDDEWLPLVEGHPTETLSIISGETDDVVIGYVLGKGDEWSENGVAELSPQPHELDPHVIREEIGARLKVDKDKITLPKLLWVSFYR